MIAVVVVVMTEIVVVVADMIAIEVLVVMIDPVMIVLAKSAKVMIVREMTEDSKTKKIPLPKKARGFFFNM
jgi:hypothetical protein